MTHYKVYKPFWRTQQPQTSEDKAMSELQQSIKDAYDKADERGEVYDHAEVQHMKYNMMKYVPRYVMACSRAKPKRSSLSCWCHFGTRISHFRY
jgi:hypothetical protein